MKTRSGLTTEAARHELDHDDAGRNREDVERKGEQETESQPAEVTLAKTKSKKRSREEASKEPVVKRAKKDAPANNTAVKKGDGIPKSQRSSSTAASAGRALPAWVPPSVKRTKQEDALCDPTVSPSAAYLDVLDERGDTIEKCLRRGPHGPPTYDDLGYALDYHAVARSRRRPRVRAFSDKYLEMLERDERNERRMEQIMGVTDRDELSGFAETAMTNRVAKDLGIPFHTVGMEEFEEWHRRGFRAEQREWENVPKWERKRLLKIETKSALGRDGVNECDHDVPTQRFRTPPTFPHAACALMPPSPPTHDLLIPNPRREHNLPPPDAPLPRRALCLSLRRLAAADELVHVLSIRGQNLTLVILTPKVRARKIRRRRRGPPAVVDRDGLRGEGVLGRYAAESAGRGAALTRCAHSTVPRRGLSALLELRVYLLYLPRMASCTACRPFRLGLNGYFASTSAVKTWESRSSSLVSRAMQ